MANITKGSVTSSFPDSMPDFTAQSETLDPASEDSTLAEGRDANRWSAEVRAIAEALGAGGRGQVSASGLTATIEALEYVYRGTQKSYAGETGRSLQSGVTNYIYLDPSANTVSVSTSSWPTTAHLRLATHDGTSTLTDERPHDLRPAAEYATLSNVTGKTQVVGSDTVPNSATSTTISWGVTFDAAPVVTLGVRRASDSNLRYANLHSVTTTGATVVISSAAPSGGAQVDWHAVGTVDTSGSGSGSS